MKIHELLEALKPSQYRKYVKGWDKSKYDDVFKGKYRIELEAPVEVNKAKPDPYVKQALYDAGYEIVDYQAGLAKKENDKRHIKIGKVLKDPDMLKRFTNDPSRASSKSKLKIVVSRHPYDIAGMSTGRGWTSCMNIDIGSNKNYVAIDIKEGTLVAYLVDTEDKDIKKPKARVLIKPFINKKSDKVALGVSNAIYGDAPDWFGDKVVEWADSVNDSKKLQGIFTFPPNLYDDDEADTMIHGEVSPEEVADKLDDPKLPYSAIRLMAKKKLITDEVLLLCTELDVPILKRLLNFCNLKPEIQIAWCNRKDDNAADILDAMFNEGVSEHGPCEEAIIAAIKHDIHSLYILRKHKYVLKSNMVKPATDSILDAFYSDNMNENMMHIIIVEFQRNKLKVPAEALKQIAKNGEAAIHYANLNHIRFEDGEKAMAEDIPNTFNTFKNSLLPYMLQIWFDKNRVRPKILLDKLKENEACWLDYVKKTDYKD